MRSGLLNRLRDFAAAIPGARRTVRTVRQWRQDRAEREYRNRFAGDCYGCFWGVFNSSDEATRLAPETKPVGGNDPEVAATHRVEFEERNWEGRRGLLNSYDYPVMFWLSQLLQDESTRMVFDFGGSVGVHFYAYGSKLCFPPDLRWTVCELPAIAEAGRQVAAEQEAELFFTSKFEDADGQHLLLASGSVQSVEDLGEMLRSLRRPPEHLVINRLPLYDGPRFVTLQNAGSVFSPQYVFNRDEFVGSLNAAGYELIDVWDDLVDACIIPFHVTVAPYQGLYLKRTNP
jgi:putative methyltransferase (TIGR04325 family)